MFLNQFKVPLSGVVCPSKSSERLRLTSPSEHPLRPCFVNYSEPICLLRQWQLLGGNARGIVLIGVEDFQLVKRNRSGKMNRGSYAHSARHKRRKESSLLEQRTKNKGDTLCADGCTGSSESKRTVRGQWSPESDAWISALDMAHVQWPRSEPDVLGVQPRA